MQIRPAERIVGFPAESGSECRTILTPAVARALTGAGFDVIAERGSAPGYSSATMCRTQPESVLRKPTKRGRHRLSCATNSRRPQIWVAWTDTSVPPHRSMRKVTPIFSPG